MITTATDTSAPKALPRIHRLMAGTILTLFFLISSCPHGLAATAENTQHPAGVTDEAQRVYKNHGDAVYQIRVIDLTSDKKTSIGSGFQISADGIIATNFHVVADAILHPKEHRLEYLQDDGRQGDLKILMADAVHDLAIVAMDKPGTRFLKMGKTQLDKGARIFSMGNPRDIGFTIIEGTYNGVSKESFTDKIHFSGSLNRGMSGGPAVSHSGAVIGINVSTAGNQISFLVPVDWLEKLVAKYKKHIEIDPGFDFVLGANKYIEYQLLAAQKENIDSILDDDWERMPFGPFSVPGRIHSAFKCWGGGEHKADDDFTFFISSCYSQDRIFLGDDLTTGAYAYRYQYLTGKEGLNLLRFYTLYENEFSNSTISYHNGGKDDVTNFECHDSFIDQAGYRWKAAFCARGYKRYPGLFDVRIYLGLLGAGKQGFIAAASAQGISQKNALAFGERFIREIKAPDPQTTAPAPKAEAAPKAESAP